MKALLFLSCFLLFLGSVSAVLEWKDPKGQLCIQDYEGVWDCITYGENVTLNTSQSYLFEYREVSVPIGVKSYLDNVVSPVAVLLGGLGAVGFVVMVLVVFWRF